MAFLQEYFQKILDTRKSKNSSYSMRSLARDLEIPISQMSSILKGKVGISAKKAEIISKKLKLNESEKEILLLSIKADFSKNKNIRSKSATQIHRRFYRPLKDDVYSVIADWYHFAILELTRLKGFDSEISTIANMLNISPQNAEAAVDRLIRLKFLGKTPKGKLIDLNYCLISPDDIPSEAVRTSHKQLIEKAKVEIDRQSVDKRDYNAHIMAISENQIPEFKKLIEDFFSNAAKLSAKAKNPNKVYCLETHLFDLMSE